MSVNVEEYYVKYGSMVYRRCLNLLKDDDMAYDALHDVFINLLKVNERTIGLYPSSFLYRIATNVCLNILKKENRMSDLDFSMIVDNIESKESFSDKLERTDLLDRIFDGEKESTKLIAVMHFIDNMSYEEISAEVDLSVSGIRKRLRKIKEKASLMASK